MQSSSQNQSMNDLLNQLKTYEEREKAFQTHLKMKDIEIQKLEKESSVNFLSFDNEKKKDNEKKRSSIRLSIFLQNKNRIKTLDVMKVKKKKKKKYF